MRNACAADDNLRTQPRPQDGRHNHYRRRHCEHGLPDGAYELVHHFPFIELPPAGYIVVDGWIFIAVRGGGPYSLDDKLNMPF
jgi:hypothetical protein